MITYYFFGKLWCDQELQQQRWRQWIASTNLGGNNFFAGICEWSGRGHRLLLQLPRRQQCSLQLVVPCQHFCNGKQWKWPSNLLDLFLFVEPMVEQGQAQHCKLDSYNNNDAAPCNDQLRTGGCPRKLTLRTARQLSKQLLIIPKIRKHYLCAWAEII